MKPEDVNEPELITTRTILSVPMLKVERPRLLDQGIVVTVKVQGYVNFAGKEGPAPDAGLWLRQRTTMEGPTAEVMCDFMVDKRCAWVPRQFLFVTNNSNPRALLDQRATKRLDTAERAPGVPSHCEILSHIGGLTFHVFRFHVFELI